MFLAALKAYHEETRRPIYSAILVLPFLLVYEVGMLILQPARVNGGDKLIRDLLQLVSVHAAFASALVLLVCFIVWQVRSRASWKVDPGRLGLMFAESFFFAAFLFLTLGRLVAWLPASTAGASGGAQRWAEEFVLYCGAGVYEELVFRVLLLGLLCLVLTKLFHLEKEPAAAYAVWIGAFLFAAFHYLPPLGDPFTLGSFLQRLAGGLFFSVLYMTRGFGVAAAAHALFDILVGLFRLWSGQGPG